MKMNVYIMNWVYTYIHILIHTLSHTQEEGQSKCHRYFPPDDQQGGHVQFEQVVIKYALSICITMALIFYTCSIVSL